VPRKSAAALSVIAPLPAALQRPEPPEELTAEEAVGWREVVGRLPPDWFSRPSHALLVAFCRSVVKARMIARLIDRLRRESSEADFDLPRFDRLTTMAERECRAISSLSTRMRLSQQSRYTEVTARRKANDPNASRKPWEPVR
jgi:hypothetical protein